MEKIDPVIRIGRETHETPPEVSDVLRLAGGINRFGEPNFRCVWGWSRLDWIGGKWEDRDEHGILIREVIQMRREPKYFPANRWHIERWLPPESYGSPSRWYAQTSERVGEESVAGLGPYPSRGDYEHCFCIESLTGQFIQLTPTIARYFARTIEYGRDFSTEMRRAAIHRTVEQQDRDYDHFADQILHDAGPAFSGMPNVSVL